MGINDHVNKIKLSLLIVPISGSIIRYVGRGGGGAGEGVCVESRILLCKP